MSNATITFPMLGEAFAFSGSNSFPLFGRDFYWYGVIIAVGFLLAFAYCMSRSRQFGISQDSLIDALIFAVPSGIIGARLYYVVFNLPQYVADPGSIVKIWEGGLAIYGGIIFAAAAILIFCRVRRIPAGALLDIGGLGLLIGQAVGRWGNFMNREAFGSETTAFCRMGLTTASGTIYVHPTFLYESVWNLLGLLLLHIYSKRGKRKYDGQLFLLYVGWYGLGRMFIEGLRTDSLYLFGSGLRVSQALALLSLLAVLGILIFQRLFREHYPEELWVNRSPALAEASAEAERDGAEVARSEDAADAETEVGEPGEGEEPSDDSDVNASEAVSAETGEAVKTDEL